MIRSLTISIIVPALNEAAGIVPFLRHLRRCAPQAQIIVADGGSNDNTADLAAPHCDAVVRSPPGRARQMNAGARQASGDILWFVHADSRLPVWSVELLEKALEDPRAVGGFFRITLPRRE